MHLDLCAGILFCGAAVFFGIMALEPLFRRREDE